MKLLAIDTTGAYSSVAIYDDGIITQVINNDDYSHLQKLVPVIKLLMDEEELSSDALDAIAVSRGPGSFTGIRIGMATAKGLAQIWNKPTIEVPTLTSFAFRDYEWLEEDENSKEDKDVVFCPIFDAKRSQIYGGAYTKENKDAILEDGAYDLSEYLAKLKEVLGKRDDIGCIVFFGDGTKVYKETLDAFDFPHIYAPDEDAFQTAFGVARLGAELFKEGKLSDCFNAQPEYLRAAEAERKLAEKIKKDSEKFGTSGSNKF